MGWTVVGGRDENVTAANVCCDCCLVGCRMFVCPEPRATCLLNPALPPQQRAEDLVHRMTVEEKVTQLVNQSRAVPRLNVPDYDWWSEALHGVARNGTTEFPEPVGLAATFDTDAIHRMAIVIGTEGRCQSRSRHARWA